MADNPQTPVIPLSAERQGSDNVQPRTQDPLTKEATAQVSLPRVTIKYCTQCKWMLRAAYMAQELLSTFSTSLGEVALVPCTGGVYTVTIFHYSNEDASTQQTILWDRKTEGGFPEIKQLKALVRNIIEPFRDLGHIDRALAKKSGDTTSQAKSSTAADNKHEERGGGKPAECDDCK